MEELSQLLKKSFILATSEAWWWALALLQTIGIVMLSWVSKRFFESGLIFFVTTVIGLLLFSCATMVLWLRIEKKEHDSSLQLLDKKPNYGKILAQMLPVVLAGFFLTFFVKALNVHWVFLILFASLVMVSFLSTLLFIVLCDQNIGSALKLTADLWVKQTQIPAFLTFSLMLAHGFSFMTARFSNLQGKDYWEFSVSPGFGRIWLLAVLLCILCALVSAWLNIFIVLGFLKIIQRKGSGQAVVKDTAAVPVSVISQ